ncbi:MULTISPECIES: DNA mismatch repair endonuclease MutL [Lactiplantibacillus]|uniref:DNA mismatch repair protein MutL n=2 Tax=Lactiplantibacillus argentoratensis TaxID=271881 RepID=A0ABS5UIH6_9LACO|nr:MULTISPECIES: DNA mismatch repair endonuclease MutL [Lactiplantibacillus]AYC71609.1 DNA mismatch repair endonuclease MutL [Lactiplantibacillus plantarum]KON39186.1 DNA mismatch repair protein MutL [Lactiplantibacillus plantarum]KZT84062.1 DNA mismatch repair protein MutL [Lactiplantibacillus plantarum]MBT1138396.1 DNA mismatch repair endonuclease MutL [Lactiplantibacillus argentoratensis]MBT1141252.1 DNA mismatch repair endonuclease MutL [Lactiplantibacillus argentoratensis]
MGKIHELSSVLADQIAAGEVVERPASVVKELVENAVDAHATQVDILVQESGVQSIRVIDDGDGIDDAEVLTAFKRHATSKITSREDLFRVHSLGFRGEALPSIASVADVVMNTSTGTTGTSIHYRGGKLLQQSPAPLRQGTDITVTDLFFNTPARLKYLKSPQTELANILDVVNRIALSYPAVAFRLVHNAKELLKTAGRGDLQQVIAGIYGVQNARKMVAIQGATADFKLSGFVALPELTRASRQYITVLINGRAIKNQQLTKAVIKGYGSKLMVGRYPIAVIALTMDPLLVDVNVHPTKQEVRLSKEPELAKLISTTITERLVDVNLIPSALTNLGSHRREHLNTDQLAMNLNAASSQYQVTDKTTPTSTEQFAASLAAATMQPSSATAMMSTTSAQSSTVSPAATSATIPAESPASSATQPIMISSRDELTTAPVQTFDQRYQSESAALPFGEPAEPLASSSAASAPTSEAPGTERFPQLRYLGQMHGTYLLAEADDGMYILDQHAAQERINYEYYRQAIGEVSADQQNLLVPIILDYPTSDVLKIKEKLPLLAELGIHLESFGGNSFIVHAHPTWFKAGQEEDTIREMIDWILQDDKLTVAQFREKSAIMMSCKRAIKANHHLDDQQARALLAKLPTCENPFNCPHGRPVTVHFTNSDMERMFKRIQDSHEARD